MHLVPPSRSSNCQGAQWFPGLDMVEHPPVPAPFAPKQDLETLGSRGSDTTQNLYITSYFVFVCYSISVISRGFHTVEDGDNVRAVLFHWWPAVWHSLPVSLDSQCYQGAPSMWERRTGHVNRSTRKALVRAARGTGGEGWKKRYTTSNLKKKKKINEACSCRVSWAWEW